MSKEQMDSRRGNRQKMSGMVTALVKVQVLTLIYRIKIKYKVVRKS